MHTLATTLLLASFAAAQTASFSTFGQGCTLDSRTLAIGAVGTPQLGTTFRITYSGPNYTFSSGQQIARPHLGLGFTPTTTPIPTSILPAQPAGCTGYLQPLAMVPTQPSSTLPQFDDFVDFPIPNDAGLIGVAILAQWLTVHEQCGFVGCNYDAVATSDAGVLTIGL